MVPNGRNTDFKIVEEVRAALFQFREAIDRMFGGEYCMDELERYHHKDFVNRWGNIAVNGKSVKSTRRDQLDSFVFIAQHYKKYGGAAMLIPWHKILLRSPEEALVAFEICQAGPYFWDRSFVLHVWRKNEQGQWQIYRMFTEQEGRAVPSYEQLGMKSLDAAKKELAKEFRRTAAAIKRCDGAESEPEQQTDREIHADIQHVEMKSVHEGVICYHLHVLDKSGKQADFRIAVELWKKENHSWFRTAVL
ncbi:hypothetical protein ACI48J_07765 [Paenibacillus chitinolyticus]|uniref:hypothetical protein n=1 Tax=Paenibacillus chitinolyticus TaxID=79263 RepID=UPI003866E08D